jgi:hypothetical protein
VEVLVSLVLLGTVALAMLAALRMTVIGTQTERDHSRAYQWLQSADGVLQSADRVSCDLGEEAVRLQYRDVIRDEVVNPPGWVDDQITVLEPIKMWNGTEYLDPPACYDSAGRFLQLITLQVTSPDGDIIETMQVVKRD